MTPKTSVIGKSSNGFTLLELLVVLAILVLAASLLPLAFNHALQMRRLKVAGSDVALLIRKAQSLSVASGAPSRITLTDDGRIVLTAQSGAAIGNPWSAPRSVQVRLLNDAGQTMNGLDVFPDASAEAARITIKSAEREIDVNVSEISGRITVRRVK